MAGVRNIVSRRGRIGARMWDALAGRAGMRNCSASAFINKLRKLEIEPIIRI